MLSHKEVMKGGDGTAQVLPAFVQQRRVSIYSVADRPKCCSFSELPAGTEFTNPAAGRTQRARASQLGRGRGSAELGPPGSTQLEERRGKDFEEVPLFTVH